MPKGKKDDSSDNWAESIIPLSMLVGVVLGTLTKMGIGLGAGIGLTAGAVLYAVKFLK